MPTLNLSVSNFGSAPDGDWRRLLDMARTAEDAGIDRLVVTDHLVNGPDVASYPWGRFPTGPEGDWLEPLTVLSAIAAVTSRIRLGTGIFVAPLRPAAVVAKTVATLDVLSGGRVDLGVGTGWQQAEFDAVGADFSQRGQLLTDTIGACRALWAGGPTRFESPTVQLHDVWCAPLPAQDRLPVWFSGTLNDRNLSRIVELGDGWIPIMGSSHDQIAEGAARLSDAYAAAGRDDEVPGVRCALAPVRRDDRSVDLSATLAPVPKLAGSGVTQVQLSLQALDPGLVDVAATCASLVEAFAAATEELRTPSAGPRARGRR